MHEHTISNCNASCKPVYDVSSARMRSEGYGSCRVCECVHVLVAQLRDKLVILTGAVSCSLQNKFGSVRT